MGGDEGLELEGSPSLPPPPPSNSTESGAGGGEEGEGQGGNRGGRGRWLECFNQGYDCMAWRPDSANHLAAGIAAALSLQKVYIA